MASIINATTTAGVAVTGDNSGALALQTNNGTTAVTIDTSQNVGIGTTSPTGKFEVKSANNTGTDSIIRATSNNGTASTWLTFNGVSVSSGNACVFYNGTTERVRIDSDGNLGIGTSTPGNFGALAIRRGVSGTYHGVVARSSFEASDNITNTLYIMHNSDNGSTCFIGADASRLQMFNSSTAAGGVYLTGGGTSWTSASDERVKENLEPIQNGLAKVVSLRAVTGNYIKDETKKSRAFLIAQDVQKVLPEAVDASNLDELGLQYADVIPLLVASIKELNAKVEAQAVRIAELEGAK